MSVFLRQSAPIFWLTALSVAMGAPVARAEEPATQPIVLKLDVEPGQAWTFDRSFDQELSSKASGGGKTQMSINKLHQRRVGTIEILAVNDGKVSSARISFGPECINSLTADGRQQNPPYPFSGKTIVVTRQSDATVQSDFQGQADAGAMSELSQSIESDTSMFPDKAVAIGDVWKAPADVVNKMLQTTGPTDSGSMTMKLLSVKDVGGRPTAELSVTTSATKNMNGVIRKTDATGTALIDIQSGHVVKSDSKGTISLAGVMNGFGPHNKPIPVRWDGSGTAKISSFSQPVGVASAGGATSKPVGAPTPANPLDANPLDSPAATKPAENPLSPAPAPVNPLDADAPSKPTAPAAR